MKMLIDGRRTDDGRRNHWYTISSGELKNNKIWTSSLDSGLYSYMALNARKLVQDQLSLKPACSAQPQRLA